MMVYKRLLISASHTLGIAKISWPAAGVQASMKTRAAISKHGAADDATVRPNVRTGPLSPGSTCAHALMTASAMPTANQVISGGSVTPNHGIAEPGRKARNTKP